MGFFDNLSTALGGSDNLLAASNALLQAGAPSRTPVGFGQALGMAGQSVVDAKRKKQEEDMRKMLLDLQLQQHQLQAKKANRDMANDDALAALAKQFQPTTPGMPANEMDSGMDMGAQASGPYDFKGYANAIAGIDPMRALTMQSALQTKKPALMTVAPGATVFDPEKGSAVFNAPDKPEKDPEQLRILKAIYGENTPAYMKAVQALGSKLTTHQPGTSVSVNTGQKGFDNTLKLRGDFRSEPIYKAHQEVQSAYSQIKQGLKMASPAGDLAGATKIMKLLDPGSVVRESELGMAMAASGLMDRLQNYAQLTLSGQKLTPTQRADFQKLADGLYSESVKQYNSKQGEYKAIADRNQLNAIDVVGEESVAPVAAPSAMPSASDIDAELARRRKAK